MSGDHNMFCSANQPDSEITKLAKNQAYEDGYFFVFDDLEAFYRAAYNKGIEAAYHTAMSSGVVVDGIVLNATQVRSIYDQICSPIRALEMKP